MLQVFKLPALKEFLPWRTNTISCRNHNSPNNRLGQLGLQPIYRTDANPLPWLDAILNGVEHVNFFENRATEYSKAATQGSWDEAFD